MKVITSLLFAGLAKRVGARLLLASTSEVYGGEWVEPSPQLLPLNHCAVCLLSWVKKESSRGSHSDKASPAQALPVCDGLEAFHPSLWDHLACPLSGITVLMYILGGLDCVTWPIRVHCL